MLIKPTFADIVVVDDEMDTVRALRAVLQSAGYTVRVASTLEKALKLIVDRAPDLILLGSRLPDQDTPDAIRSIRSHLGDTFVPLIVIAGEQSQAERTAGLNAGADEIIRKPVDNTELLPRARAMLRLKATNDALNEMNAALEQKVRERTIELEQAHAHLRHVEKLSSLGRLSASVAHEINNPLACIFLLLDMVKGEIPADLPVHQELKTIRSELDIIGHLVERLQDYSKPPRRERYQVDLSAIVNKVLALTHKQLQKSRVKVGLDLDSRLPPITASPEQIGEVFMNLILNAMDAMDGGGTLALSTAARDGLVIARVKDTGVGMGPDVLERVFEPFFTTKGDKGTGLGLAICYSIVTDHGGEITVESRPGQGTTFELAFPSTTPADNAAVSCSSLE